MVRSMIGSGESRSSELTTRAECGHRTGIETNSPSLRPRQNRSLRRHDSYADALDAQTQVCAWRATNRAMCYIPPRATFPDRWSECI